jgi:polyhydroxyalkanoate synthesis repressor PhaR
MKGAPTRPAAPSPKPRRRGRPPKLKSELPEIPGVRLIKKYGNRRLYDSTLSRAVTMEEIAAAVRKGEDLRVLDGETGEDITKRILVQIILEEQSRTQLELLPVDFLRQLIQLRSEPLSQWMSQYLSAGAQWLGRQMSSAPGPGMRGIQESLETLFPWMRKETGATPPEPSGPVPDPDRDIVDTIDELQQRLADLSKRVMRR